MTITIMDIQFETKRESRTAEFSHLEDYELFRELVKTKDGRIEWTDKAKSSDKYKLCYTI